jgi:hypothetical protein
MGGYLFIRCNLFPWVCRWVNRWVGVWCSTRYGGCWLLLLCYNRINSGMHFLLLTPTENMRGEEGEEEAPILLK